MGDNIDKICWNPKENCRNDNQARHEDWRRGQKYEIRYEHLGDN